MSTIISLTGNAKERGKILRGFSPDEVLTILPSYQMDSDIFSRVLEQDRGVKWDSAKLSSTVHALNLGHYYGTVQDVNLTVETCEEPFSLSMPFSIPIDQIVAISV